MDLVGAESYIYDEIKYVVRDPAGVTHRLPLFGVVYAAKTEISTQLHCLVRLCSSLGGYLLATNSARI